MYQGCRSLGGLGEAPGPPDLADQLSLFQPAGVADYAHHITTCPPPTDFQTNLRPCVHMNVCVATPRQNKVRNFMPHFLRGWTAAPWGNSLYKVPFE